MIPHVLGFVLGRFRARVSHAPTFIPSISFPPSHHHSLFLSQSLFQSLSVCLPDSDTYAHSLLPLCPLASCKLGSDAKELSAFPDEIVRAFAQHRDAEASYEASVTGERDVPEEDQAVTELKRSTRALFRSIGRNLELVPGLIAEAKEVPDATDGGLELLITQMRKLRELLFEKLLTTVDEERNRQDYLSGLISREEELNAEIEKLEDEVKTLSDDRDAEVDKREKVINRVIKDLEAFAMHGEVVARRVRKEADKRTFRFPFSGSSPIALGV